MPEDIKGYENDNSEQCQNSCTIPDYELRKKNLNIPNG
jgi:hypothetical protein